MYAKSSKRELSWSRTSIVAGALPFGLSPSDEPAAACTSGASKEKIFCGELSSVIVKSSFVSPVVTGRPFLSSTVTSRNTSEDVTLIVRAFEDGGAACDCVDCGGVTGDCCDCAVATRPANNAGKTTPRPARRSFIVVLLKHSGATNRLRRPRWSRRFYGPIT